MCRSALREGVGMLSIGLDQGPVLLSQHRPTFEVERDSSARHMYVSGGSFGEGAPTVAEDRLGERPHLLYINRVPCPSNSYDAILLIGR